MVADTVRILVVGDSCVGKTSLAHLLATGTVLSSPAWTVGATAHVLKHDYNRHDVAVELLDVSGSRQYARARTVFYEDFDGVILVHDVTNRPSFSNLRSWLEEVVGSTFQWRTGGGGGGSGVGSSSEGIAGSGGLHTRSGTHAGRDQHQHYLEAVTSEQHGGISIPVLIVGTKIDEKQGQYVALPPVYSLADSIQVSTQTADAFAPHNREGMLFKSFLDHVVNRQSSNSYGRLRRRSSDVSEEV